MFPEYRREVELQREGENYRIEGYWRNMKDERSELPWPVPNPGWGEAEFLRKLRLVEQASEFISYRGGSKSRLTGEMNGSREYVRNGWRWPQGFGHYIDHGVKPSNDFIAFITSEAANLTPNVLGNRRAACRRVRVDRRVGRLYRERPNCCAVNEWVITQASCLVQFGDDLRYIFFGTLGVFQYR